MTDIYIYDWQFEANYDTYKNNNNIIKGYGITCDNKSVCILIDFYKPFLYLELPDSVDEKSWCEQYKKKFEKLLPKVGYSSNGVMSEDTKDQIKDYMKMEKLYFAQLDSNQDYKKFPTVKCVFPNKHKRNVFIETIKRTQLGIKKPKYVKGKPDEYNEYRKKLYNHDIRSTKIFGLTVNVYQEKNPKLEFLSENDLPTVGWVKIINYVECKTYLSDCQLNYKISKKGDIWQTKNKNNYMLPSIMSVDIEVYSSNPHKMPDAETNEDEIFQISCVHYKDGKFTNYLLSKGSDLYKQKKFYSEHNNMHIKLYDDEECLLNGYYKFMKKMKPQVIIGYNIFGFDFDYMYKRDPNTSNANYKSPRKQYFNRNKNINVKIAKWSSSAYKNQNFIWFSSEGVINIDLLPIIKRDHKLNNYKLNTVAEHFIGKYKDPLTAQDIFKCYDMSIGKDANHIDIKMRQQKLEEVGKYCVQDSKLVIDIFLKLKIWIGLAEMANICNVAYEDLYTKGQQIKIYSQVYKHCLKKGILINKDDYIANEDDRYEGAMVFDPICGAHDMVVPFDFSSLYPTTMIAYNIDYSSYIPKCLYPHLYDTKYDYLCHIIKWEDHIGCKNNCSEIKGECGIQREYRFLKYKKGVIPLLLENLLNARKKTKQKIKQLKKSKTKDLQLLDVLDKRQLSYKVSANSMYGAMGVKAGYLPFMVGAMCTTAQGRKNIQFASDILTTQYENQKIINRIDNSVWTIKKPFRGLRIYGDTDSCYIQFKHILKMAKEKKEKKEDVNTATVLWDYCREVEDRLLNENYFPTPMKLAFEEKIYSRFFILTKKRYMALTCYRDGIINKNKIMSKGVLLARRDNSLFLRETYSKIIMDIFENKSWEQVKSYIDDRIDNQLFKGNIDYKKFIMSKSIGNWYDTKKEDNIGIYKGDYKIRDLPSNISKRKKRLDDLFGKDKTHFCDYKHTPCWNMCGECEKCKHPKVCQLCIREMKEYKLKALPAAVQLAHKLCQLRGKAISPGSRISYIIINKCSLTSKSLYNIQLFKKIEDPKYFHKNYMYKNKPLIEMDYIYYLHTLISPIDQLLSIQYKINNYIRDKHYKRLYGQLSKDKVYNSNVANIQNIYFNEHKCIFKNENY